MLHYIIQTVAFQLFFLIIYDVFLKKETFFNWNRLYLLGTALLSLLLPLIKIDRFKNVLPQDYVISLPEILLGQTNTNMSNAIDLDTVIIKQSMPVWEIAFWLGVITASCLFIYKLTKILVMIFKNPKTYNEGLILIKLLNSNTAFSFFRCVFLGDLLKKEEKEAIIKHELIHVKQWHSIDLLVFEVFRILFWFNPLVYMYQNRITQLHEFVADAEAVKHQNKSHYYQNLLAQVFDTQKISFINPFFKQSLIKKRIVMLQKSKSKQIYLLKYALLIPMVFGMLVYTSCSSQINTKETDLSISDQIELLKTSIEDKKGVISENDKAELFKLINGDTKKSPWKIGYSVNINPNEVPFGIIEQPPIFPECKSIELSSEQKQCFLERIAKHVHKNFNKKIANENKLTGKLKITVIFKIDKEGSVVDVRSIAPHPALEEEAIRVVKTLPKMIPGEQDGKKVNVPFALPIIFQVEE